MTWHNNPFTGIFTRQSSMPVRPHDPDTALASGMAVTWQNSRETATGSGIGWTASQAEDACVGEAIERLQAAPLPDDQVVRACFDELDGAIDPARWVLFHVDQYQEPNFPFEPLKRDIVCDWVCFRQAITGEARWAPAELAYLHWPVGRRICPGYSTGLAAGREGHPLLLRGVQEVIERDAVLGAWWGRYPLEEFAGATFDILGLDVCARVQRPNLRYRFYRVDSPFSDHVTVVTLEGEDREGFVFSIGSSCRETRRASWEKSLQEAIHGRHYVRHLKSQIASGELKLGRWPRSFPEHAVWYSVHPKQLDVTILRSSRPESQGASVAREPESIRNLSERLGSARPILFRSMTPPALASEQMGWHVLRVLVPGLQPLHGDHAYPHLGGSLWMPRGAAEWAEMLPHPFP